MLTAALLALGAIWGWLFAFEYRRTKQRQREQTIRRLRHVTGRDERAGD